LLFGRENSVFRFLDVCVAGHFSMLPVGVCWIPAIRVGLVTIRKNRLEGGLYEGYASGVRDDSFGASE
jgi:hypothetical protein